MTVAEWLKKANKLLLECQNEKDIKNGSKKISTSDAHKLNQLQHDIGSHHSIREVTNNEAVESLEEMIQMVNTGLKTPPLTLN